MSIHQMLCLSLKQEINFLNSLIDNIPKGNPDEKPKSWILPTKSYQYVTDLITAGKYDEASYQDYLELTIDRLYAFMRLTLHYLNNPVEANNGLNPIIIRPTSISIGLCAKNIWEFVVTLIENQKHMLTKTTSNGINVAVGTQTDISTLDKCDSCFSAIECMKNLLNLFNDKQWRNRYSLKMYDTTQFGCMTKATSRVEDCFKYLHRELHERTRENSSLKLQIENVEKHMTEKERKITFLETEVKILKEKLDSAHIDDAWAKIKQTDFMHLQAYKVQLTRQIKPLLLIQQKAQKETYTLHQEHDKLIQDNNTKSIDIKDLNKHLSSVESNHREAQIKCDSLKNENLHLKKHLTVLKDWLKHYIASGDKKVVLLEENLYNITKMLEEYKKSFTHLNLILVKLTKNIVKCDVSVKKNQESLNDIGESITTYQNKSKKIVDIYKERFYLSGNKSNQSFKIQGNPVEDFTKQIKENTAKISQLQNDNIKLEQLLNRFRELEKN